MDSFIQSCIALLNDDDKLIRLKSLSEIKRFIELGQIKLPVTGNDVNNHIHTFYSFSPYSPSKAVFMAYEAGLATAGIMDHDTISGAEEFIEAGKIIGLSTTIGLECRADFSKTTLRGRRINNPDQKSNAYIALHGIPHTQIETVNNFFEPFRAKRNIRNRTMVRRLNENFNRYDIFLHFEDDVVPLSKWREGGSITERHILFALAKKITDKFGKGESLIKFVKEKLNLNVPAKIESYLKDISNEHYEFDLLGLLKSEMVKAFYVEATEECPNVTEVLELSEKVGAISAYAYLGDVGDSVTGDKKKQKFEDEYIEELFSCIKALGFNAVTYMPSRNTAAQLKKVKELCSIHGFFEISGEDINSPRQKFICEMQRNPEFNNLFDSTWALVGHETKATENINYGMFTSESIAKYPSLNERIKIYKEFGLGSRTCLQNK